MSTELQIQKAHMLMLNVKDLKNDDFIHGKFIRH